MFFNTHCKNLIILVLLMAVSLFSSPLSFADELNEDQTVEGSAFDSMEDLVSEFDEELNDNDLEQAIQADSNESSEEPEPSPAAETEAEVEAEVSPTQDDQNKVNHAEEQANTQSQTSKVEVAKTGTKAKANALLVLKSKQRVKIWINKRYRGVIAAGKTKPFPVRAGKVVVTAKTKNKVRRYVKQIKARTKTTALIDLSSSKRARVRKNVRKARKQKVKKAIKRATKKATKKSIKRATKKARKKKRTK